jgi:hypothetical protein
MDPLTILLMASAALGIILYAIKIYRVFYPPTTVVANRKPKPYEVVHTFSWTKKVK